MILDIKNIEAKHNPAFKGGEKEFVSRMFVNELGKIMLGHLEPGASIGLHTHEGNSEIIYLLNGEGTVLYDGKVEKLLPGQVHYCPMGHEHSLRNETADTPLDFFAVVPEHHVNENN